MQKGCKVAETSSSLNTGEWSTATNYRGRAFAYCGEPAYTPTGSLVRSSARRFCCAHPPTCVAVRVPYDGVGPAAGVRHGELATVAGIIDHDVAAHALEYLVRLLRDGHLSNTKSIRKCTGSWDIPGIQHIIDEDKLEQPCRPQSSAAKRVNACISTMQVFVHHACMHRSKHTAPSANVPHGPRVCGGGNRQDLLEFPVSVRFSTRFTRASRKSGLL